MPSPDLISKVPSSTFFGERSDSVPSRYYIESRYEVGGDSARVVSPTNREILPFSRRKFDSSLTITQTACPSCLPRIVLDVLQNSSKRPKGESRRSVFVIIIIFSLSLFFYVSFSQRLSTCIRKGYCRLNPVVADVVGVAVVGPFVAVHPEMSVIWTAMLGSRQ